MQKMEVLLLENSKDSYRRAYILLMAACNDALDLLPTAADAAILLQNAVEQAEEVFLQDAEY